MIATVGVGVTIDTTEKTAPAGRASLRQFSVQGNTQIHSSIGTLRANCGALQLGRLYLDASSRRCSENTPPPALVDPGSIAYLNRAHIILVSIEEGGVALTTTLGMKLFVPGRPEILEQFMDQLLNASDSNFVAIPTVHN